MFLVLSFLCLILYVPLVLFLERRLLGTFQLRLGVFIYFLNGLLVFLADFIKIISKFNISIFCFSSVLLTLLCVLFLIHSLAFLLVVMYSIFLNNNSLLFLFIILICLLVFIPYYFLNLSYITNSIYAFLGSMRFLYVLISIELIITFVFFIICSIYLNSLHYYSIYSIFVSIFILFIYILFIMADTGRLPFDQAEAESELVSGYSTELYSFNFILVFFSEYVLLVAFIFFISHITHIFPLLLMIFILSLRALCLRIHYLAILKFSWFYSLWGLNLSFIWFTLCVY